MNSEYYATLRQFVLGNEAKNLREELYEFMTISTLCQSGGVINSLKIDDLVSKMEENFHLKNLPSLHVIQALEKLEESGIIIKTGMIYSIPDEQCKILSEGSKKSQEIENSVKKSLEEKITKQFDKVDKKIIIQITQNFFNLLDGVLEQYGAYATRLFSSTPENTSVLDEQEEFHSLFKKNILKLIPHPYHDVLYETLREFFFNPSDELAKYLYSIAVGDTFTKILNADPHIQLHIKKSWEKKSLVIDTNVIIDLLFSSSPLHNSLKLTLEKSKALGITLYVLEETIDEFISWLNSMRDQHQFVSEPSKFTLTSEILKDNVFLNEFLNEKDNNKLLNINDFASTFEHVEHIMKQEYGVKILQSNIKDDDVDENLLQDIKNASYLGRKNRRAQLHDFIALETVRIKRKESEVDETGPTFWFLTEDNTLSNAEKSFYGKKETKNSVGVETWLQIIMPYVSPTFDEITAKAFSKLISSNFVLHKITTKNITKVLRVVWQSRGLNEKHIQKTLSDDHISQCFEEIQDASYENNDKKLDSKLQKLTKLLDEKYLGRIDDLETDRTEHLGRIDDLETDRTDLKNKVTEHEEKISSIGDERDVDKMKLKLFKSILIAGGALAGILLLINWLIIQTENPDFTPLYAAIGLGASILGTIYGIWYSKIGKK